MKYLLAALFLIICGCHSEADKELAAIDSMRKDIDQIRKENGIKIHIIDCELGVLFTIDEFKKLLQHKTKKSQLDHIWSKCEALK